MTVLPSWRASDPDGFADVVVTAAQQLGVRPLAVEKDYWACEALRAMTVAHPGEVVFKGGTSLEKLRIIRRFSEDLDLLVVGEYGSNRAAERALKSMIESAADATGGDASGGRNGGKPGSFHRSAYLAPPLSHSGEPGAIADAGAILVELGQSGGPSPHRDRQVTSLLARQLADAGFDTSEWGDLAAFDVAVLHPGRTLIEKLLRVNNFASAPAAQGGVRGWPRIGRQFYDLWALLGNGEVLEFLTDKPTVAGCSPVASRSPKRSRRTYPFLTEASLPAQPSMLPARSQFASARSMTQRWKSSTTAPTSRPPSTRFWSGSTPTASCWPSTKPRHLRRQPARRRGV